MRMVSGVSNSRRLRGVLAAAKNADPDLTYDRIAVRAGELVSKSFAQKLVTSPVREAVLSREQLEAISRGFGADFRTLLAAHLEDMGLMPDDGRAAADGSSILHLPSGAERLTPKQRAALVGVARAMIDPDLGGLGETLHDGDVGEQQDEQQVLEEGRAELRAGGKRRGRASQKRPGGAGPAAHLGRNGR